MSFSVFLGAICFIAGLTVLLGYLLDVELLYRPFSQGEATHPLTAISLLCLAFSLAFKSASSLYISLAGILVAAIIVSLRFLDEFLGLSWSLNITPFGSLVLADLQQGKSNSMGVNTASMLLLVAGSVAFNKFNRPLSGQFLAFISLALPVISLTGYAYGIVTFYGKMSVITSTIGCILTLSALFMTANVGGLKAILSPTSGGNIARIQTLASYCIPFLLGFLVVKSFDSPAQQGVFGLYVVGVGWLTIIVVAVSATMYEVIEQQHQISEAQLKSAASTDPLTKLPNRGKLYHSILIVDHVNQSL